MRRRQFLKAGLAAGATYAVMDTSHSSESSANNSVVVRTTSGRVRGRARAGVCVFKGIPYGESTAGSNRFRPPQKATPWSGVRDAIEWGSMAPQQPLTDSIYATVLRGLYPQALYKKSPWFGMGEDCLCLNVWTAEPGHNEKRPVMVWLHPGSFSAWAGNSAWTDGTRLARRHNVVIVSLNHRLGVLGHLYLGHLSSRYIESGNLGMLDVVQALTWIRDNIGEFGGDPSNVTVFGESGGAGKVSALMAMRSAKGLFHKAVVQSGSWNYADSVLAASRRTDTVLQNLNIRPRDVDRLQQIPFERIVRLSADTRFCPIVDGVSLNQPPFDPTALAESADVPLIVGTTKDEMIYLLLEEKPVDVSDRTRVSRALVSYMLRYGVDDDQARHSIDAYRQLHSSASWHDTFVGVATAIFREDSIIQAERKAALGKAAVFRYLFDWSCAGFEGVYKSMHTFDVPFVFNNLAAAAQLTGTDARSQSLATRMSGAWAAFAHTGTPSHAQMPEWLPYDGTRRSTMRLNCDCVLQDDPDREERLAFQALRDERLKKAQV